MAIGRTNTGGGGGGGGLNYNVIGGTSQPSNPEENTIWVNTDVEITSHVFSATEPESPAEGMVWFSVGTSSATPINLLKKDNIVMIYPTGVKQYIGGAWENKTAKTYQGGAWLDWSLYLFKGTEDVTNISGGWTNSGGSFTIANGKITTTGAITLKNKTAVNMTPFNTIFITCKITGSYAHNGVTFKVYNASGTAIGEVNIGMNVGTTVTLELDISGVSGENYFGWQQGTYNDGYMNHSHTLEVYEIKLDV